jgi:hypothetical protein
VIRVQFYDDRHFLSARDTFKVFVPEAIVDEEALRFVMADENLETAYAVAHKWEGQVFYLTN